jgi:hypothetical protein
LAPGIVRYDPRLRASEFAQLGTHLLTLIRRQIRQLAYDLRPPFTIRTSLFDDSVDDGVRE